MNIVKCNPEEATTKGTMLKYLVKKIATKGHGSLITTTLIPSFYIMNK